MRSLEFDTAYLPNIYMPKSIKQEIRKQPIVNTINIGCFGAIRPLKNQLIQAMAAIAFAKSYYKHLRYHINSNRVEQRGSDILKNIQSLFKGTTFDLVEHAWASHDEFIKLVQTMDLGLQVSYTESFNIVTADFVDNEIPIVVSNDISWVPQFKADPNSLGDIVHKLFCASNPSNQLFNQNKIALQEHNRHALRIWSMYLN